MRWQQKLTSLIVVAAGLNGAFSSGTTLWAQGVGPARRDTPRTATSPAAPSLPTAPAVSVDQSLASCVSIDSHAQIALARFVEKNASSEEVKRFATILRKDHQAFLSLLEQFTPEAGRDTLEGKTAEVTAAMKAMPEKGDSSQAASILKVLVALNPPKNGTPATPTGTASSDAATQLNGPQRSLDFLELHREMASQWVIDSQNELNSKTGAEFDLCYVRMQIAKRSAMATELTVLQRNASSDLAVLFKTARSTVAAQKIHGEKLFESLSNGSGQTAGTRPATAPKVAVSDN